MRELDIMTVEKAIEIGINKVTTIQKMAELIKTAEKKEDILYILERMQTELDNGLIEIEQIEKSIKRGE